MEQRHDIPLTNNNGVKSILAQRSTTLWPLR
jgi:hypothetical protein